MVISYLIISVGAAIVVWLLTFPLFFKDFHDYLEAWKYSFVPDIISLFQGKLFEDWWASTKLSLFHSLGVVAGIVTYFWRAK